MITSYRLFDGGCQESAAIFDVLCADGEAKLLQTVHGSYTRMRKQITAGVAVKAFSLRYGLKKMNFMILFNETFESFNL